MVRRTGLCLYIQGYVLGAALMLTMIRSLSMINQHYKSILMANAKALKLYSVEDWLAGKSDWVFDNELSRLIEDLNRDGLSLVAKHVEYLRDRGSMDVKPNFYINGIVATTDLDKAWEDLWG
jgi:hypothetical protein